MHRSMRWLGVATVLAAVPVTAQERYNVQGENVAIYNLAGDVSVVGAGGNQVTVAVTRGGRDAAELRVEVGPIGSRETLRVIYPADHIVYESQEWRGTTRVNVRPDGTWGGSNDGRGRGDRVTISNRGSGMDAHANLEVGVPRGQRIQIYIAVGRITASNVDGQIWLDTHAGPIEARGVTGSLGLDTGSGSIVVDGVEGDLEVDTGSGSVRVSNVRGSEVAIDSGSGAVSATDIVAPRIEIDTGSGGIDVIRSSGREVTLDTGSGAIEAELSGEIDRLEVDTGSGSVTLYLPESLDARLEIETGSGGIEADFPIMVTRRARDELRGQIGNGTGLITVDTGSGSIRLRRR